MSYISMHLYLDVHKQKNGLGSNLAHHCFLNVEQGMLNNEIKTEYYTSTFDIPCSTFCGSLLTVGEVRTKPPISLP